MRSLSRGLIALAGAALTAASLSAERPADAADPSNGIVVISTAPDTIGLRVGRGGNCEDTDRTMVFDGQIRAHETLRIPLDDAWCACVSATSVTDRNFRPWQMFCGPYTPGRRAPWHWKDFQVNVDGR